MSLHCQCHAALWPTKLVKYEHEASHWKKKYYAKNIEARLIFFDVLLTFVTALTGVLYVGWWWSVADLYFNELYICQILFMVIIVLLAYSVY